MPVGDDHSTFMCRVLLLSRMARVSTKLACCMHTRRQAHSMSATSDSKLIIFFNDASLASGSRVSVN